MPESEPTITRGLIVHEHTSPVHSVAFSPNGKSVASSSNDTTIRICDAYRPVPVGGPLNGHTGRVWSVCYSPLGNMVVSGGIDDKTVRLWDLQTGQQVGEALRGHASAVNSVAFSPNCRLIASGSNDKTIRLWNVQSGGTFPGSLQGHTDWVCSVAFSPDSARIASGSGAEDKTIRIWDIERRIMVGGALQGHESTVRSVYFSPDGSQIISGSYDKTLRLWDVRTEGVIGIPFEGHTANVRSVAFSPSGTCVASASADKTVRIWDIRTHRQAEEPFEQHTRQVHAVAFSTHGRRVASGSEDSTVMIWNLSANDSSLDYDCPDLTSENNANNEGFQPGDGMASTNQCMSGKDIFDCLLHNGCVNLNSQTDPELDAAVMRFGDGFGDTWAGELRSGIRVRIRTWRAPLIEQCDKEKLECAIKDIRTWSGMKHKNIHQLMGVAMPSGRYLGLITERMENGNLYEYMRSNPSFDQHQMCTQVTMGLVYMHQSNMIHGDLKAFNVLVSSGGVAKLSNFGHLALSAAYVPFSETSNSQAGGMRWVAPELLCAGASKTKESDVYALGMTILEVITGDVPYPQCQWEFQVLSQVTRGELPSRPVNIRNDESGDQMWELLMSCWDKDPDSRPLVKEVLVSLVVTTID